MGTSNTRSNRMDVGSDALFRTWGKAISDAIADCGEIVKTSDTGQVNWTTVTRGGTTSTTRYYNGYEMYRFDDSLQSTAPVFIRLDYGHYSGASSHVPELHVTLGKATDGAGTITNVIMTRRQTGFTSTSAGNVTTAVGTIDGTVFASASTSHLAIVCTDDDATPVSAPIVIVERSRDPDGDPNGDGLMLVLANAHNAAAPSLGTTQSSTNLIGSVPHVRCFDYATGSHNITIPPVVVPHYINGQRLSPSFGMAVGGVSPVYPWLIYGYGQSPWQSLVCVSWVDDPVGTFTAAIMGSTHTYRGLPIHQSRQNWGIALDPVTTTTQASSSYVGLAILWE